MKKHVRIFALVLALSMALMTGCGKKTYATAEEWYNDNAMAAAFMNAAVESEDDGDQMTFGIEGNTVVYGMEMDEAIFGESEEMDTFYKSYFDSAFESEKATYVQIITELADLCGIPASELAVRIDIYNPGASTPGYTTTITSE